MSALSAFGNRFSFDWLPDMFHSLQNALFEEIKVQVTVGSLALLAVSQLDLLAPVVSPWACLQR